MERTITLELSFGRFIEDKRTNKGITLRGMAKQLDIAPSYLSDIEKGRRNPPDKDTLELMANILALTDDDRLEMYDLAGKMKDSIPPDLPDYIMKNKEAVTFLRTAQKNQISSGIWKKLTEQIENMDR